MGAVLVIFAITIFAFVWVDSGFTDGQIEEADEYNYYERFPDPKTIEIDLKTMPKLWPAGGVDLVYIWTRSVSEARVEEYQSYFRTVMTDADLIVEEMPGDFAQMQHYFARGVDAFAPWVKNLYIIIPDSAGSLPFNKDNERIHFIQHSQLASESMLPMFNPRAILLNFLDKFPKVSSQFVLADDLTYPISYISPFCHRSRNGTIILPTVHTTASMPLQDAENKILLSSAEEVKKSLLQNRERLGFSIEEIEHITDIQNLPQFEHRGWQFLDKAIIADLKDLCEESLARTQTHRLLRKSSVDLVYMHHVYIYWQHKLYQNTRHAQKYIEKYDLNKDGFLDVGELKILAQSLGFLGHAVGQWAQLLNSTSSVNLQLFFTDSNSGFLELVPLAVEPKFRNVLHEGITVALELRRKIPIRLSVVMPILKSGIPKVLWAGPRLLGPSGSDAKEAIENFLWIFLRKNASPLEAVYKPNPMLGLMIGIFYFVFFFGSAYLVSKILLSGPIRARRTSD